MGVVRRESGLVAIVDDDESIRGAISGALSCEGLTSRSFSSAEEFLRSGLQIKTACMILDIQMRGMSGLELQHLLTDSHCRIPIIFVTASHRAEARTAALRRGAVAFLVKPFNNDLLISSVRAAVNT